MYAFQTVSWVKLPVISKHARALSQKLQIAQDNLVLSRHFVSTVQYTGKYILELRGEFLITLSNF